MEKVYPNARYPYVVRFANGRVQHFARLIGDGPYVVTLCKLRGLPDKNAKPRLPCRSCSIKPNPMNNR